MSRISTKSAFRRRRKLNTTVNNNQQQQQKVIDSDVGNSSHTGHTNPTTTSPSSSKFNRRTATNYDANNSVLPDAVSSQLKLRQRQQQDDEGGGEGRVSFPKKRFLVNPTTSNLTPTSITALNNQHPIQHHHNYQPPRQQQTPELAIETIDSSQLELEPQFPSDSATIPALSTSSTEITSVTQPTPSPGAAAPPAARRKPRRTWASAIKRSATYLTSQFNKRGGNTNKTHAQTPTQTQVQTQAQTTSDTPGRVNTQSEFRRKLRATKEPLVYDDEGNCFRLVEIGMNGDCGFASIAMSMNICNGLICPITKQPPVPVPVPVAESVPSFSDENANAEGNGTVDANVTTSGTTIDEMSPSSSLSTSCTPPPAPPASSSLSSSASSSANSNPNTKTTSKTKLKSKLRLRTNLRYPSILHLSSLFRGSTTHPTTTTNTTTTTTTPTPTTATGTRSGVNGNTTAKQADGNETGPGQPTLMKPEDVRLAMSRQIQKAKSRYLQDKEKYGCYYTETDYNRLVNEVKRSGISGHWLGSILGNMEHVILSHALHVSIYLYQFDLQKQTVRQFDDAKVDNPKCSVYLFFTGPGASGHFDALVHATPPASASPTSSNDLVQ